LLQGIIDRHIGCLFLFGGDLNVSKFPMNGCNRLIHQFSQSNKLNLLDPRTDVIDYAYHNDANGHFSLIDYFLASPAIVDKCDDVYILDDADNPSDHFAVLCKVVVPNSTTDSNSKVLKEGKLQWEKGDTVLYSEVLSQQLSTLCLPTEALICTGHCNLCHKDMIERYYQDLVHCMNNAATYCIPVFKSGVQKHWWTPELDELKQKCIIATDA